MNIRMLGVAITLCVTRAQAVHAQPVFFVQVNTDVLGHNILGDAGNEPSIAVDPTNPSRMAIGWRQFDTITNNFRQAGVAYTTNGGLTWTPSVLTPGLFRSDPVLRSDATGNFYYSSLSSTTSAEVFKSTNGGATWGPPVNSFGGDKQWLAVDNTNGPGRGNVYQNWNVQFSSVANTSFTRSTNGGASFEAPVTGPTPFFEMGNDGRRSQWDAVFRRLDFKSNRTFVRPIYERSIRVADADVYQSIDQFGRSDFGRRPHGEPGRPPRPGLGRDG